MGFIIPRRILIVVDFPAPFGPRKPKTSPLSTDKLTLVKAVTLLRYCLFKLFISIELLILISTPVSVVFSIKSINSQ